MHSTTEPPLLKDFSDGIKSGVPIFLGYFTTSVAFGLLAVSAGLTPFEAIFFSMSNLTGAAQFMAINLISAGAAAGEIIISVALLNLRYFIMSASLARKLGFRKTYRKMLTAFGVTDEVFSVASLKPGRVTGSFMLGLQSFSWFGWSAGTLAGVTAGSFLPRSLQDAMAGALFALFAALLVPEIKKSHRPVILAGAAAGLNTLLYYKFQISAGWSIVISMISVTAIGAAIFREYDEDTLVKNLEAENE